MTLRRFSIIAALLLSAAAFISFKGMTPDPEPEPVPEPEEILPFELSVPVTQDWVYEGKELFTIHVENPNEVPVTAEAKASISTDKRKPVTSVTASAEIPGDWQSKYMSFFKEHLKN